MRNITMCDGRGFRESISFDKKLAEPLLKPLEKSILERRSADDAELCRGQIFHGTGFQQLTRERRHQRDNSRMKLADQRQENRYIPWIRYEHHTSPDSQADILC